MELTIKEREKLEYLVSDDFRALVYKILGNTSIHNNFIDQVIIPICKEYNVTQAELVSNSRLNAFIVPRHLAIFILFTYEHIIGVSKKEVLKFFNKNSTARVDFILVNIYERLKTDKRMKKLFDEILLSIKK